MQNILYFPRDLPLLLFKNQVSLWYYFLSTRIFKDSFRASLLKTKSLSFPVPSNAFSFTTIEYYF